MPRIVVTRGSQITLTKDVREKLGIREGDVVTLNTLGRIAIVAKRDPAVWRRLGRFLPEDFEEILREAREASRERFGRLGLT